MDKHFYYELAESYLDGTATQEERRLVEAYYAQLSSQDSPLPLEQKQLLKEEMWKAIQENIHPSTKVVPMRRWWKVAAAAAVITLVAGSYFLFNQQPGKQPDAAQTERFKNDITPVKGGATLTLADGSLIYLENVDNGQVAAAVDARITKQDDQLVYAGSASLSYNSVSTDKGKNYQLTLADGTKVWLDAMSSIRFPTAFPGEDRVVELSGQAYFEVAHNARQPFKVKVGEKVVEVLGTHFNVNAHEAVMKTTLLEGAVRIQSKTLKPGEQAQLGGNGQLNISQGADIAEVMAWKDGRFRFTGSSIEEIFSQLARWYEMEVVYQDKIPEEFVANISRDVPLSRVLNLLEMTKQVRFRIEGKKVTVMK
jgi:transmembrane sensor